MPLPEPSPDMIIDVVDTKNRPIGTVRRRDVFKAEGGFRTVHVFVLNSSGGLLLQQQSRKRARAPLTWGSSVAAYMFAGEDYESAARRRLEQEIGIKPTEVRLIGVVRVDDLGHDKFVGLVECTSDGPFRFDRSNIARLEFSDLRGISAHRRRGDRAFTPTFLALFKLFLRSRGKSSPQTR
jgi:ADP-ribose pyrophosphatase YjhB (NUDIX family)